LDYRSHGKRWQTIGGPVDTLIIKPDEMYWHSRKEGEGEIKNFSEFKKQFQSGKLQLRYLPPYSKAEFEAMLFGKEEDGRE
jgi:hypothetical protein